MFVTILAICLIAGLKPGIRYAMQYLGDFIDVLSLINSSFNFILCALMSNVFRQVQSTLISTFFQNLKFNFNC